MWYSDSVVHVENSFCLFSSLVVMSVSTREIHSVLEWLAREVASEVVRKQ